MLRMREGVQRLALGFRRALSRRWWWSTLLVMAGVVVMVRLGIWQLDRLEQRRARNARVLSQLEAPPLLLNTEALPEDLEKVRLRRVEARGEFDFRHQVVLKNQSWYGAPGVHLITPLRLEGREEAVLVDRGWIPYDLAARGEWTRFDEPGPAVITGYVRLSQASLGARAFTPTPSREWFYLDVQAIQAQVPYPLLPIYILQAGSGRPDTLPYRGELQLDLSEGPHLGYALQWFTFALIAAVGYVYFVGLQEEEREG